jgi:hypothetical protein
LIDCYFKVGDTVKKGAIIGKISKDALLGMDYLTITVLENNGKYVTPKW